MGKTFIKILKSFDIFGTLITFQINRDNDYKSLLGGIFSLFYILVAFLFVSYYTYLFIARKEISLIYSTNIIDHGPFINLTAINFNFAFNIQYHSSSSAYSDFEKYFIFSVRSREWHKNKETIDHYLDYKLCSTSDFYNLNDSFNDNDLGNFFCPIIDSSANFSLEGLYTDNYYKYIIIDINLTSYAMEHKDELRVLMEKHRFDFSLYFLDTSVDYENRKNPLPIYINYLYKNLDIDFIKYFQVFISSLHFYNDENIIIENPSLQTSFTYDNLVDNFQYFPNRLELNETLLGQFIIKASPKIYIYQRTYQKLPHFIGELYGICEEFLQLLFLIVKFMEKKAVDRKLIQRMLKFRGSKYYDIEYLQSSFRNKEVDEHVNTLISKERLSILKTGNIKAKRASVNEILIKRQKSQKNYKQSKLEVLQEFAEENENNLSDFYSDRKLTNNNDNNNDNNNNEIQKKRSASTIKSEETISDNYNNPDENKVDEIEDLEEINTYNIYNNRIKKKNKLKNSAILGLKDNYFSNNEIKKENPKSIKIHRKNNSRTYVQSNNNLISLDIDNKPKKKKRNFKSLTMTNTMKIEDEKLGYYTTFDFIIAYCCNCCTKKLNHKYSLLRKCELKIHYYLDIYTYIKKMQEIDLIKYCLFDQEQMKLFNFLAKPPVKFSDKNIGIYKEFEKEQINYSKTSKKEMDEIFEAYSCIGKKNELTFEDIKLLRLVNADIEFLS